MCPFSGVEPHNRSGVRFREHILIASRTHNCKRLRSLARRRVKYRLTHKANCTRPRLERLCSVLGFLAFCFTVYRRQQNDHTHTLTHSASPNVICYVFSAPVEATQTLVTYAAISLCSKGNAFPDKSRYS